MKVKFAPIFNRKNRLNSNGLAPIEIRIYQDRKRRFIATGIMIKPLWWDKKNREINKKHPDPDILNFKIKKMVSDLEKRQVEYDLNGKHFSIDTVSNEKNKLSKGSFIDFVKEELKNDQLLRPNTKTSHLSTLNKMKEYKKGKDIKFAEVDYIFVDGFLNFLRQQKLAINTVHKQHKNLKKCIEVAIKKGHYKGTNPCKEIRLKYENKKREVLTIEEIRKIENLDLRKHEESISVVRDMFLFSCYTGLRISDSTNLKPEYVKKDKGTYSLDFVTIKVNKRAEIPLHILFAVPGKLSKPETILEKYYDKKNEFVFPRLTEPYINRQLKVIASLAGVSSQVVTFHTARHSFGTYMATKIPLPQLMYLMQHSDIKTTMTYVNIGKELVKQGLMKIDWE